MCPRQTTRPGSRKLLLASVESFCGENKELPSTSSLVVTGIFIAVFLIMVELTLRQVFTFYSYLHPLLEDETNRNILARHIGVDALSCFIVVFLGWKSRHLIRPLVDAALFGKKTMPVAFETRMFTYHPEATRMGLVFLSYQVKNLYDTIAWNDGPEFILHHVLCLFTVWGALFPGSAHFYVPFYFGVSEASTAVLCLLANFDDVHGVKGLADAFPMAKVVIGGIFAVTFIACRVFMWSTVSYYYCRDAWNVLKSNDKRLTGRKTWLQFTFVSLGLLTVLQVVWLAEIARVGKEELGKIGLI